MEQLGINGIDITIGVILLLSALFAYMRGFVHEVLSVGGWVGATFAALYGFPYARPYAREFIPVDWMADLAAGAVLFVVSLLVLSVLSRFISRAVQESSLNAIDRALGFLFGLARGTLVVLLIFLGISWMSEEKNRPDWLVEARSYSALVSGSDWLVTLVPEETARAAKEQATSAGGDAQQLIEQQRQLEQLQNMLTPEPKAENPQPRDGYGRQERKEMDRLNEGLR